MCPESGRAIRYAQCHFGDIGALERLMLRQVGCIFCNRTNATSSCVNLKQWKSLEICVIIESMTILLTLAGRNFYNMLMTYQNHS